MPIWDLLDYFAFHATSLCVAGELWPSFLLDFSVLIPDSIAKLPWKYIPDGLDLWDEENRFILVAQLASPHFWHCPDPVKVLSLAFESFLDREIR